MGLFLAILVAIATVVIAWLRYLLNDLRGERTRGPLLILAVGNAFAALLAFTHFHPIGW